MTDIKDESWYKYIWAFAFIPALLVTCFGVWDGFFVSKFFLQIPITLVALFIFCTSCYIIWLEKPDIKSSKEVKE